MLHQLTEDQATLRESIRAFAEGDVRGALEEMDKTNRFPRRLLDRAAEIGITGLLFPEEYGGSDMGLATFCLVMEEISRVNQTVALVLDANSTLCFLPILQNGTDEQKNKYLPGAVSGELMGAFAMSEPSGATNFSTHTTKAVRDGDGWIISGTKIFCTNAGIADVYLIYAGIDGNPSPTCFIVEKGAEGLTFGELEEKLGWHGTNTGTLHLDGVRVTEADILGAKEGGLGATIIPILESCVGIGAMCCGAAAGAYQLALDYTKKRIVGDQPTIAYQSVGFDLARMAMDIEVSRALVYKTAGMIDDGGVPIPGTPLSVLTSACKITPPEMAARVCDKAIQLHGGAGYVTNNIHRYWRDVRACQIGEGPTSSHLSYILAAISAQDLI